MKYISLKCPACGSDESSVIESRGANRRRECKCGQRFTTQEKVFGPHSHTPVLHKPAKKFSPDLPEDDEPRPTRQRVDDILEARSLGLSLDSDDWSKKWPTD